MKRSILFFGGSSLLALNWAKLIYKKWNVTILLHKRKIEFPKVNILSIKKISEDSVSTILTQVKPLVVVNCAAITNIEKCESEKKNAKLVNTSLPQIISKLCDSMKIKFIHISSDHLFDGSKSFYKESELTHPLNYYSNTKVMSEKLVNKFNKNALIVRTNFYAWGPSYRKSFSDLIIESLRKGSKLKLFNDVYYTPILISELVRILHLSIEKNISGILNVCSDERISKYEFGINICEHFKLLKSLINPISIKEMKHLVKRPMDMSLSNKKLKELLNTKVKPLKYQIEILKNEEKNKINI